jgi:CHAD domain-containing protein
MTSKRETERKYDIPAPDGAAWLPDLAGAGPVHSVSDPRTEELDAVYYDTDDLRLARASVTLRRRTGGSDAGWHLKLPLGGDSREEVGAPLSDAVPDALRELVLSRTRGAGLRPVARIRSSRAVRRLLDRDGGPLAELSLDRVRAHALPGEDEPMEWAELEVELAEGADPALLDAVDKKLRKSGVARAAGPSKLARALRVADRASGKHPAAGDSPGGHVVAYLREHTAALVAADPAVRRDLPDSVHSLRVACRRLRSCLRSYRSVLDRRVTDPVRAELRWLAGELGAQRDQEVLGERIRADLAALPDELVLGPVAARLKAWEVARGAGTRARTLEALSSPRYLRLLDALADLTENPPLRRKAGRGTRKVLGRAVLKEYDRLAGRVERALELPPGRDRDAALHQARKSAKKVRYAADVAGPALGRPAGRLGKGAKALQKRLGAHQDGVVARDALRDLAVAAQVSGEPGFTWGLLHGQERERARAAQEELPCLYARLADRAAALR